MTDPERFVLAVRPSSPAPGDHRADRTVGFGIAVQREHVWFLSQLYVLPEEQRSGIGRALLAQVMPSIEQAPEEGAPARARRDGIMATCTDSVQPVSNGLYARHAIVPRVPVFNLVGTPGARPPLPPLPAGVAAVAIDTQGPRASRVAFSRTVPTAAAESESATAGSLGTPTGIDRAIDELDRQVLGYAHPIDHAYLRSPGRTGFVYVTADGSPVAYGYSSEVGRFGPVAVLDDTLTAPVIGHLMASIRPRGATSAWIPGANDRAMVALLRAGLRIEGFPAQLCWTRPFAAFERYVPASLALL